MMGLTHKTKKQVLSLRNLSCEKELVELFNRKSIALDRGEAELRERKKNVSRAERRKREEGDSAAVTAACLLLL